MGGALAACEIVLHSVPKARARKIAMSNIVSDCAANDLAAQTWQSAKRAKLSYTVYVLLTGGQESVSKGRGSFTSVDAQAREGR
ncbi:MAG: hypothetical protein WA660_01035, partial [Candidatus Acidiferrales bacterium]